MDDTKEKMLENLDRLRRRVLTGEVVGLITGAVCIDGCFLSATEGEGIGAEGILVLEEILLEEKRHYLEDYNKPHDDSPMLSTALVGEDD